jgi:hypothetical protein
METPIARKAANPPDDLLQALEAIRRTVDVPLM